MVWKCLQTLKSTQRSKMENSSPFFLGFILHLGKFKHLIYCIYSVFKRATNIQAYFLLISIFVVPNFDNNNCKTWYFLEISPSHL